MPWLEIVFGVSIIVLTAVISAVGYQLYYLLKEIRGTNLQINTIIDEAESQYHAIVIPLQQIGSAAVGLKSALRVMDSFTGWLNTRSSSTANNSIQPKEGDARK